jgi:hypothetical protein
MHENRARPLETPLLLADILRDEAAVAGLCQSPRAAGGKTLRRFILVIALALLNAGCMTTQLRQRTNEQAATIPDVYYQQVLDNLAMIQANPDRLPYFSDPQTSRNTIARTANVNYGVNWDLITMAPAGVLSLFDRYLLDKQSAQSAAGQTHTGEWATVITNDPDKLLLIRAAYRLTSGTATTADQAMVVDFYFKHYQITEESLQILQGKLAASDYAKIKDKLAKLIGIEFWSSKEFLDHLAEDDVLGKDGMLRYRLVLLQGARITHFREVPEFNAGSDPYSLAWAPALQPGWFGVGGKKDVPKNACYVGHYCDTYVWVCRENLEMLSMLTLAILDIDTSGATTRRQPGLIPRV